MPDLGDLAGAAAFFAGAAARYDEIEHSLLEKSATLVETEAKRVIGTYDYGWPPLKPETVERKATGDSPLLETGAMRDSIGHVIGKREAQVGSDDEKAVWQELGTSRGIPPRPFLAGAAMHKEREVVEILGKAAQAVLEAPGGITRRLTPP